MEAYNKFFDVVETFNLYRGKGPRDLSGINSQPVGYFKGKIRAYRIPDVDSSFLPSTSFVMAPKSSVEVIVRVYIIEVCSSISR